MKQKNKLKYLQGKQAWWDKLSQSEKIRCHLTKRPGSIHTS